MGKTFFHNSYRELQCLVFHILAVGYQTGSPCHTSAITNRYANHFIRTSFRRTEDIPQLFRRAELGVKEFFIGCFGADLRNQ